MRLANVWHVGRLRRGAALLAASMAVASAGSAEEAGSGPPVAARPPTLGGPEGDHQQVEEQGRRESGYAYTGFQRLFKPYVDWKSRLKDDYGLGFGFLFYFLGQGATDTTTGRDGAFGGIFRFHGSWEAFARHTGHSGRLEWRVETRYAAGGVQAPSDLGASVGAAALNPGNGYVDDFDIDLSVFNWTQHLAGQRVGFALGRLAFDSYLDSFYFQTFSRGFLNRSFLTNPTMGTSGIGALGAVLKGFVTKNFWLGGQIYDANAVSGEFDTDTIAEGEFLESAEIGWTPSYERHGTDRVQFTYWHKDALSDKGVPSGQGWVVSASWEVLPGLIPFTRFGHSDGGGGVSAESAFSAGLEWSPAPHHALSFGGGWADPAAADLRDEYVVEGSWLWQVSPNLSLLADAQLMIHPASNAAKDAAGVFGVRAILTF